MKLEVGKQYVTRQGEYRVTIEEESPTGNMYGELQGVYTVWKQNGCYVTTEAEHFLDLQEESLSQKVKTLEDQVQRLTGIVGALSKKISQ